MSRYVRRHILQAGAIVDSVKIDDEMQQAFVPFNGGLDSNNFPNAVFAIDEIADQAVHELVTHLPFAGTGLTLGKADVDSRGWTFDDDLTYTFTSSDEGVLVGSYSGTVQKFGQVESVTEMGWGVAAFLDGRMVARTELTAMQVYSIELPFTAPVEKGAHTLRFAYRGLTYKTSVSSNDVFFISPPLVWWVFKKR
jgi:hypothetical protein